MKKFLLSLVAMMIATVSFAQSTFVVTLTHGDNIRMYYGVYAFQNAMKDAQHGDVMNLSAGSFQSTKITKAVSIRGAGMDADDPTRITGDFYVDIPTTSERLSMEGVRVENKMTFNGQLNNPYFTKCYIEDFFTSAVKDGLFANCMIRRASWDGDASLQFVNSYVSNPTGSSEETANAIFLNCIISFPIYPWSNSSVDPLGLTSSILTNCIIGDPGFRYYTSLPSSTFAYNCISVGNGDPFTSIGGGKNNEINVDKSIFIGSSRRNDLTEEAKAKYLGNDGTPVGMYGGILPYNTTPSYPQITKMNVAQKTTADGKLSVEIEVNAGQ